jgi:hypothetical protein
VRSTIDIGANNNKIDPFETFDAFRFTKLVWCKSGEGVRIKLFLSSREQALTFVVGGDKSCRA